MGETDLEAAAAALRAELAGLERRARLVREALAGIEALLADRPAGSAGAPAPSEAGSPPPGPPSAGSRSAGPPPAGPEAGSPAGPTSGPRPAPSSGPHGDRPVHTRDAIVAVMADEPEREWSPQLLTDELERRGWGPDSGDPVQAVRAATSRLARDGRIERVRKGAYLITPDELAEVRRGPGGPVASADPLPTAPPRASDDPAGTSPPPSEETPPPQPRPEEPPPIVGYGDR